MSLQKHRQECDSVATTPAAAATPSSKSAVAGTSASGTHKNQDSLARYVCEGCGRQFATHPQFRGHRRFRKGVLSCSLRKATNGAATPAPNSALSLRRKGSSGRGRSKSKRRTRSAALDEYQYVCQFCRCPITKGPRIHCVECKNTALCLECFAAGNANEPHSATHKYRVNFNSDQELLDSGWDINDECAFVEGLKAHGVGNWAAISKLVSKSEAVCRRHFEDIYLAKFLRSEKARKARESRLSSVDSRAVDRGAGSGAEETDNRKRARSDSVASSTTALLDTAAEDDNDDEGEDDESPQGAFRPKKLFEGLSVPSDRGSSSSTGHGGDSASSSRSEDCEDLVFQSDPRPIAGFLPKRRDFAVAWDNADDDLVGTIDMNSEDREIDKKLKLEILRSFHRVVQQRNAMSDFVIRRGLVNIAQLQHRANAQPAARQQLEIATSFAARHLAPEEYDRFVSGHFNEVMLQAEIAALEQLRDKQRSP